MKKYQTLIIRVLKFGKLAQMQNIATGEEKSVNIDEMYDMINKLNSEGWFISSTAISGPGNSGTGKDITGVYVFTKELEDTP